MAQNTSGNAPTPQKQDSAAKQKAEATAQEAKDQAQGIAQDARAQAKDLAQSAQHEAGQLKEEALQQARSLAETVQGRLGEQAGTQQERAAAQARSFADDLHRLASGEQPQNDAVRQVVASVADRAEALTQRLETAQPADLLDDVRRFAARRPGTFLAIALGAGLIAGRMTRGLRDAAQDDTAHLTSRGGHVRQGSPAPRRAMAPEAVHSDITPHHLDSQVPAHTADVAAPRRAADAPVQADAVPTIDPLTGEPVRDVPFDQTQPEGRA
ncbi:ATP synthase F0 subunit B [Micrococcus sp.]|uniref:ATP synthase F0 subunit B n=1 Tax=Micrococcus sp. TaxID=1271 RepID=UPI002A90C7AE|nr:ATP synthase F0 subunit B [Micrococcus sp.]MDY6054647.1 ATP synthase F0 subunit B [Micrococcus sp.]